MFKEDMVLLSLLLALGEVGAFFWCSIDDFGQENAGRVLVILTTRFLLSNNINDWFIYFRVIFCGIRLSFTINSTSFNNHLIYIMKLQVFMLLWSGFGLAVCCNHLVCFVLRIDWLVSAWCGFSASGNFRTDFSTWRTFLMLLKKILTLFVSYKYNFF